MELNRSGSLNASKWQQYAATAPEPSLKFESGAEELNDGRMGACGLRTEHYRASPSCQWGGPPWPLSVPGGTDASKREEGGADAAPPRWILACGLPSAFTPAQRRVLVHHNTPHHTTTARFRMRCGAHALADVRVVPRTTTSSGLRMQAAGVVSIPFSRDRVLLLFCRWTKLFTELLKKDIYNTHTYLLSPRHV